jgi:hypothetical protein
MCETENKEQNDLQGSVGASEQPVVTEQNDVKEEAIATEQAAKEEVKEEPKDKDVIENWK